MRLTPSLPLADTTFLLPRRREMERKQSRSLTFASYRRFGGWKGGTLVLHRNGFFLRCFGVTWLCMPDLTTRDDDLRALPPLWQLKQF